jgi:lipoprotein-releasing system permease protein
LRYLKAKRKESFISLISVISVAGVALGVMALIVVMSVMNGFRQDIREKIIGAQAHVMVASYDQGGIPDWQDVVKRAEKDHRVVSISPYLTNQVMLKHDNHVEGVMLWGVDPAREAKVTRLKENMKMGRLEGLNRPPDSPANPLRGRGIILGLELAQKLGVLTGDEITVIAPVFKTTAAGTLPKVATFKVVGVFEAGMYEFDATFAYISLDTAQTLFEQPGSVNGMAIKVDDLEHAPAVARDLQRNATNFWARDFMSLNRNLATALETEKLVMFIILIMIVMVAAFNIASTLIMVVMEKKRDIGVLKAMGASNRSIMRLFMLDGAFIGIGGTVLGLAGGLLACLLLKLYPLHIPGGGSVYYIENLPVATQTGDVVMIVALTLTVCLFSTIYPAWQASRLDPVEAIRYE